MGDEFSTSGQEINELESFVDVFELMAALAGDEFSRPNAIRYFQTLVKLSQSDSVSIEVKRSIGFFERLISSLSSLSAEQMNRVYQEVKDREQKL